MTSSRSQETVEIRGHLLDSGVLSRCASDVRALGGDYVIERLDVGKDSGDESYARIKVTAEGAQYWDSTSSGMVYLWEVAKANITGTEPKVGEARKLDL